MREPVISLAFTPEPWVEQFHRHFTDHGGVRIRQLVMDPSGALDDDYEVLVASARWPALTIGLVDELHDRRRAVLGVASRDDRGSAELLTHIGVDRIVMSDASPAEFLEVLLLLSPDVITTPRVVADVKEPRGGAQLIVVRGPSGSGATEIAVGISGLLSEVARVALIDLDEVAPSIAQRLAIPLEPNLRTAIDAIEYGLGDLDLDNLTTANTRSRLRVVAGMPNASAWSQVRPPEVERAMRVFGTGIDHVVADIAAPLEEIGASSRGRYAIGRMVLSHSDVVVAVGLATPVGLSRLLTWLGEAHALIGESPVHVVLNRVPKDSFRTRELAHELERNYEPASLTMVPDDAAITSASWEGSFVGRCGFARATKWLANELHTTRIHTDSRQGSSMWTGDGIAVA